MNRGNIIAKLSCQVYKFLSVQFIKKDKETQNYWLTDVMIEVQNAKKKKKPLNYTSLSNKYFI